MMVLVTYDVATADRSGQKRLQRVAKKCQDYGQRVQNSVFECSLNMEQFARLKSELLGIVQLDSDSLRFYFLGNNWEHRIEHHGAKSVDPMDGPLMI